MIKNYFKVAVRNLYKHRFFSLINIFGLSLSMSICILLIMVIADQKSNDQYNNNKSRTYRITTKRNHSDSFVNTYATAPLPLKGELEENIEGIDKAVRIRRGFGNGWINIENDVNIPVSGFFVDPEFISVFDYELESGDPNTALAAPNSVVLQKKTAVKLFGNNNPVGESIKVGELGLYKITGVLKEAPHKKSHIKFEALASLRSLETIEKQDSLLSTSVGNWQNTTAGWVYVQLNANTKPSQIEAYLHQVNEKQYGENEKIDYSFLLQPLTKISPGALKGNEIGPVLPMLFVYFLSGLALIIMLSASFNYMNLSIARALTRAKEVGIRKVVGAMRYQLIFQFLTEAILISFLALALSQILLLFLKPAFKALHFAQLLQWDLNSEWTVQLYCLLFSLMIGLLSGIAPALILSSFKPIKVLKDLSGIKLFSKVGLRKVLIVSQFTFSLVFIISATLVYKQLKLMLDADFGFNYDKVVNVRLGDTRYDLLRNELMQHAALVSVAAASHVPASGNTYDERLKKDPSEEGDGRSIPFFYADQGYLSTLNISLLAGENFDTSAPGSKDILINEQFVHTFQLGSVQQAVGQFVYISDSTAFKIKGVVQDYNHQALMQEIKPMFLRNDSDGFNLMHLKLVDKEGEGIDKIKASWNKINPDLQLDYSYFEQDLKEFYELLFGDLVKIVTLISALALVISSLGLLGMATYTTETRVKEVCIRKILGATDKQLIFDLSKSFVYLILVAIVLAVPLAYFINNLWLELIAYRVGIDGTVLLTGVVILLLFGILTIGSQTYRAIAINPAKNLRNE